MARNYPVRHNKSTSPIVLTDASLVDAGCGEHTVSDAAQPDDLRAGQRGEHAGDHVPCLVGTHAPPQGVYRVLAIRR